MASTTTSARRNRRSAFLIGALAGAAILLPAGGAMADTPEYPPATPEPTVSVLPTRDAEVTPAAPTSPAAVLGVRAERAPVAVDVLGVRAELPRTGVEAGAVAVGGAALLGAGAVLMSVSRRRADSQH